MCWGPGLRQVGQTGLAWPLRHVRFAGTRHRLSAITACYIFFVEHTLTEVDLAGTPATPRPNISEDQAAAVAAELYNLVGGIKELGSQQDRNFRFDTTSGRYLLKFANPDFSWAELEAQNIAMAQLAAYGIAAPTAIASVFGNALETVGDESPTHVRLTNFVEGEPLTDTGYLAADIIAELGRLCAQTTVALAPLTHEGLDRVLQWDLRRADSVVTALAEYVSDREARSRLIAAVDDAWQRINDVAELLRVQPIHGDLTDDNVVCGVGADGRLHPFGVIDLGDVSNSWLVAEIAITCSSILHHNPTDPLSIIPAIIAFNEIVPLSDAEVAAIWPMIITRGAVLAVSGEHQVATDPTNEYAAKNLPHEWVVFDVANSLPCAVATQAIRDALGLESTAITVDTNAKIKPMLGKLTDNVAVVDFSTTSPALNDGEWLTSGIEAAIFTKAKGRTGFALARYGEDRLTRSAANSNLPPANHALHVEIATPAATKVVAPVKCQVVATTKTSVTLRSTEFDVRIDGIKPAVKVNDRLPSGKEVGTVGRGNGNRVRIQLCTEVEIEPPSFVEPRMSTAWRHICPDPTFLLGIDVESPEDVNLELLHQRRDALASVVHHYYERPPQIERGWKSHLIDTHARSYLDMCNNVSSVGHSHPRIAAAAEKQWRLLNTNSRFHYSAIAEYAQRLAALAPDPLDTVMLVNSGTEAVDLAIRTAQMYTGHQVFISHAESYHGWSMAADAVSASTADNPAALTTRPDWVKFLNAPNWYRGVHRGFDSGPEYVADAAAVIGEWSHHGGIAGFICEPIFGNGGGIILPDGYLAGIYELVRSYGGLCIADEVQVGAGRLGHYFWGIQQQDVVPDIITIAKPFGNGQPIGAMITRREIAERLAEQGNVFSSAGGSPVSCRIGIEILDIFIDEQLPQNAAEVGDYLRQSLTELATKHDIIGAVHGMGLYLGLEFVRDRTTLEPAAEEAQAICNRLLDLGIIEQTTGDRFNVLKIKPPICLTKESADFFVDTLDYVLTNGW